MSEFYTVQEVKMFPLTDFNQNVGEKKRIPSRKKARMKHETTKTDA